MSCDHAPSECRFVRCCIVIDSMNRTYVKIDVITALFSAEVVNSLVGVGLLGGHFALVHQPLQTNVLHA